MTHPALIVTDAIQEVTAIVQQRLDNGERSPTIDAADVIEILLSIAERIENAWHS